MNNYLLPSTNKVILELKDIKIQKNKIIDLKRTRLVKSSRQLMPATFL